MLRERKIGEMNSEFQALDAQFFGLLDQLMPWISLIGEGENGIEKKNTIETW